MKTRKPVGMRLAALLASAALGSVLPSATAIAADDASGNVAAHATLEDPVNRSLFFEELELRDLDSGHASSWDASFWVGRTFDKLTIRTAGQETENETTAADLELLWTRSFARWWDFVAGTRTEFAPEPGTPGNSLALGVQGIAPYGFDVEATAYAASGGDYALHLESDYDLPITPRFILEPQVSARWYGYADAARGIGQGLSSTEIGLRLRYEWRRELSPYIGVERERKHGATAELERAAGREASATGIVAGVRLRF